MRTFILCVKKHNSFLRDGRVEETINLAQACDLEIVGHNLCVLRKTPSPSTYIGKGWMEKVAFFVDADKVACVIVDAPITPLQKKNLEKAWGCLVWDRTALILEIFGKRAKTDAGKLQVQLARLFYQKTHLVKAWSHLERQRGGFGFLGGPGESQLELDHRMLEGKIMHIKKKLEKVRKTRQLHRHKRKHFPTVSLVGYTNAGKSTVFHMLTGESVLRADMLFATLDPVARKVVLPSGRVFIITDTVGFISELPHFLQQAFQATLEEIKEADLLLHIHDVSSLQREQQAADVQHILKTMQCTVPVLSVFNKSDRESPIMEPQNLENSVLISALKGTGKKQLLESIESMIFPQEDTTKNYQPEEDYDHETY